MDQLHFKFSILTGSGLVNRLPPPPYLCLDPPQYRFLLVSAFHRKQFKVGCHFCFHAVQLAETSHAFTE